jgi:hypothetical protein
MVDNGKVQSVDVFMHGWTRSRPRRWTRSSTGAWWAARPAPTSCRTRTSTATQCTTARAPLSSMRSRPTRSACLPTRARPL